MSDILNATFAGLLSEASADGADLVKWGGDAVLLLSGGPTTPCGRRGRRTGCGPRCARIGRIPTSSGTVVLRMSVGVHSGDFDFFLVGDPEIHRELLISGPGASTTADMEAAAAAGQIGLSAATAALLPPRLLGPRWTARSAAALRAGARRRDRGAAAVDRRRPRRAAAATDPGAPSRRRGRARAPRHHRRLRAVLRLRPAARATRARRALAEALDDVVRNVQQACADNEVTFFETDINRDGGKIMLTAGAPRSADHNEERMLRVARQVLDHAGRLPLRIGVNRGPVFAGDFGPPFRRTYSVKGDAINLAARVMGKAHPGQAAGHPRGGDAFADRLPDHRAAAVPGQGQVAARAGGRRGRARRRPARGAPGRALVGRDARSWPCSGQALEDVRARGGPAGRGRRRARHRQVAAGRGAAGRRAATCPWWPSAARSTSRRRRTSRSASCCATSWACRRAHGADEVARRLTDRVSLNAPHLLPWLPLLGIPMDVPLPPTAETEDLDEEFRKARLEDGRERAAGLGAAHLDGDGDRGRARDGRRLRRPAAAAVADARRAPVAARWSPAGSTRWASCRERRAAVTSLRPAPLDQTPRCSCVQRRARGPPADRRMRMATLARRSGGNPMFLEALVREVSRSGSVADLPDSVEALVTSQIDRLPPADRRVAALRGGARHRGRRVGARGAAARTTARSSTRRAAAGWTTSWSASGPDGCASATR